MAHLCRNCHQPAEQSGKYCSVCLAHKNIYYRLQLLLASVIGMLALLLVIYASPQQQSMLKPISVQAIAVFDEFAAREACEMGNGEGARHGKACSQAKTFQIGGCAERKLNSARDVITSLIRKGTTKLHLALS
jgi:hypothetical protein